VRVTLVPSAPGEGGLQHLSSYLVNDAVAIDAGCLGLWRSPREQAQVRHVLLTHTHIDHLASLPAFLMNVYTGDGTCVTVHGSAEVLDCLRRDLFNDRLWPDFIRISTVRPPYLRLNELKPGAVLELEGLRVTAVPVNHAVPTLGFIVEDREAAVVVPSDTGPTEEIWERAGRLEQVRGVFLECTFPNGLEAMARISGHLTPALFTAEMRKLGRPAEFFAVHIHPVHWAEVTKELGELGLPAVRIGEFGKAYEF
jgi:ribonuclease BN (tRNA processing enzyme)